MQRLKILWGQIVRLKHSECVWNENCRKSAPLRCARSFSFFSSIHWRAVESENSENQILFRAEVTGQSWWMHVCRCIRYWENSYSIMNASFFPLEWLHYYRCTRVTINFQNKLYVIYLRSVKFSLTCHQNGRRLQQERTRKTLQSIKWSAFTRVSI